MNSLLYPRYFCDIKGETLGNINKNGGVVNSKAYLSVKTVNKLARHGHAKINFDRTLKNSQSFISIRQSRKWWMHLSRVSVWCFNLPLPPATHTHPAFPAQEWSWRCSLCSLCRFLAEAKQIDLFSKNSNCGFWPVLWPFDLVKGLAFISPNSELSQGIKMALRGHVFSETFKGSCISCCHLEQEITVGTNNRHTEKHEEKSWKAICFGG